MAARWFLAASVLIWFPYGIWCFLDPGTLAGSAGVEATTPTGVTELRAMYGGLQMSIGLLAAAGFAHVSARRPALLALAFLAGGLAVSRLIGGILDDSFSGYTTGAVIFELATALIAIRLLGREEHAG